MKYEQALIDYQAGRISFEEFKEIRSNIRDEDARELGYKDHADLLAAMENTSRATRFVAVFFEE